jgi:hypothetical protein
MFVAQGTAQWELWTGQRAPVEAMRRAVVAALEKEEVSSPIPGMRKLHVDQSRLGAKEIRTSK